MIPRKYFSPACLVALTLWTTGCGGAQTGAEEPEAAQQNADRQRVETLVLQPTTFEDVIERTGTVKAISDATLSAQSSGTVEMLAPLGQSVQKGTIVAQLNQTIVRAVLEQTEAQLENALAAQELADDNYARQEPLYRDSIISALEFQSVRTQQQQAQAGVRQATAMQTQAQQQLDNTTLRAPFSGSIEAHLIERGEQVTPGMYILRIVNTQRIKISVGVPERYADDIKRGSDISFGMVAYPGELWTGQITFAGSTINPSNRTFSIETEVSNDDGRLKPEMIARVFISRQQLDSVLVVPRSAIVTTETGDNIYVVANEGNMQHAKIQKVTLGTAYEGMVIVKDGLDEDAHVIVLGHTTLTEGDSVEIEETYSQLNRQGIPVK